MSVVSISGSVYTRKSRFGTVSNRTHTSPKRKVSEEVPVDLVGVSSV